MKDWYKRYPLSTFKGKTYDELVEFIEGLLNSDRIEFYKKVEDYEKFANVHFDTAFLDEMFEWYMSKFDKLKTGIRRIIPTIPITKGLADGAKIRKQLNSLIKI